MEKRLKKTEDFTPDIRDLEIKGDLYRLVEYKMALEAPGYQYGYISYSFGEKELNFQQGQCYLHFSSHAEALAYMNQLAEPLPALDQLGIEKTEGDGNTETRYRFGDTSETRIELVLTKSGENWLVWIFLYNEEEKYHT